MRSTEDKLIHLALNVGMNQGVSPRLAPTGTLYSVRNCRISGNGVLEKRPGSQALTGTTAKSPSHSLQGDGAATNIESPAFACQVQSALMVGNTYGDAFAFSSVWQFQGRFSTCLPVRKRYGLAVDDVLVSGKGFGQTPPDVAVTASGYIAVVAIENGGILHAYIEDQNGVRLYYLTVAGPVVRARLAVQGDTVLLVAQVAGPALAVVNLTITNGQVANLGTTGLVALSASDVNWDVSSYSATAWYLAYQSAAAVITLKEYNLGVSVATQTFACTSKPPVTIWADSAAHQLWVGFYDDPFVTGNVKYSVWDISASGSIVAVKAATTLKTGLLLGPPMFGRYRGVAVNVTKQAFYCFGSYDLVGKAFATWVGSAFGSATAPTTPVACWHVTPIGKPDNYNRVWCIVNSFSTNQLLTRVVLLRFVDETLVAPPTIELSGPNMPALAPSFSPFSQQNGWFVGNGGLSATRSYAALPNVLQQFYSAQAIVKFDVYEYTTAEQESHRHNTRFGATTTISGQPVEFWGQSVATIDTPATAGVAGAFAAGASEIGFPHAPIVFSITPSNGGSGFGSIGTRSWRVTFEWIDLYGRRHQSAPSLAVSSSSDAVHGSATLVIGTTDITQRQAANTGLRVFLRVYRTVAGGTEYHEIAPTAVAFDQTDGLISFEDGEPDSNIAQSGFIYTDGGVLDDTLAPSCRFTCKSEDRIWFGGLWDANIILCSKVIVPGEPIQCTDDFSHQVQLPGPCTGLAYMDGNVVAFTADAIYLIGGDGPNDQGAGAFPPPRCLTRSIGCCDYRSIVETNTGVMFQANQGLYMVPRGFGPAVYFGVGVQDEMTDVTGDTSPTVYGAISHTTRDNHLARFLVGKDGAIAQTVLTYDIDGQQWFKDTLPVPAGEIGAYDSLATGGLKGAVFVRADLSTATSSTPVYVEATAAVNDLSGAVAVQQYAETAWVHPFGLGGWGKVNAVLLAVEALGASQTLTVTIQTDANATQVGTWTVTATGVVSYRALYISDNRACTSIQVQIQGDAPAGSVGGFKFISCTLEVEPTAGLPLLADAEKN